MTEQRFDELRPEFIATRRMSLLKRKRAIHRIQAELIGSAMNSNWTDAEHDTWSSFVDSCGDEGYAVKNSDFVR